MSVSGNWGDGMFDVQPAGAASVSYIFQVRLILASKHIVLLSESRLIGEAAVSGRSPGECAAELAQASSNVQAIDEYWDKPEIEYP